MGKKTLGLDLGTNSIGWAVIDKSTTEYKLLHKGVHIFPKGVGEGKAGEYSLASERTGYRSARRIKFRRKLRKIETLKTLSQHGYCPKLSDEVLSAWRNQKKYPTSQDFRNWLLTFDQVEKKQEEVNPYYFRHLAVNTKLNLDLESDRFKLGRAIYHLCQRRGYLSNALDQTEASDGAVNTGITELQKKKAGKTLGEYFYSIYGTTRIRNQYTSRKEDYLDEFKRIIEFQQLPSELSKSLEKAIFFQRPLKSQKGSVANCPFEPKKKCVQISHPVFERFRMFSFINNIKIKTPEDETLRPLNAKERQKAEDCFNVKTDFKFDKIAKALVPKKAKYIFCKHSEKTDSHFQFNYPLHQSVAANNTLKSFYDIFEVKTYTELLKRVQSCYINAHNKTPEDSLFDLWHVLTTFTDSEKRQEFAVLKLGLSEEKAVKFDKTRLHSGYASISLKAAKGFVPFLERGVLYSHAAFLANVDAVLKNCGRDYNPDEIRIEIRRIFQCHSREFNIAEAINEILTVARKGHQAWPGSVQQIEKFEKLAQKKYQSIIGKRQWNRIPIDEQPDHIEAILDRVGELINSREFEKRKTIKERVELYLKAKFGATTSDLQKMYHPSAMETYSKAPRSKDGNIYLESPRISAIKNPVFMRTMHRLKALVNALIKEGIIDEDTTINIEMARSLNDANRRKAIANWQRKNETKRTKYRLAIAEYFQEQGIAEPVVSETAILKYQLWEEQKHTCPYSGKTINISDFLGNQPSFDIEHTFPRSRSCDDSQENKTLTCARFNRDVKKAYIPAELNNYDEILSRIEGFGWRKEIEKINKKIEGTKKHYSTKEAKDNGIVLRRELELERNYLRAKLSRFTMEEIPRNFTRSQLVNTQMICKYAKQYMHSAFKRVNAYKALALKPFFQYWGVETKERDSHLHHCVDAILAACISQEQYKNLAEYFHSIEKMELGLGKKPHPRQPWNTFAEDLNTKLKEEVLVTHYSTNNLLKQSRKKLRIKGEIQKTADGKEKIQTGDTVRGSLHKETFYGAVMIDGVLKYVGRKAIKDMSAGDKKKIVDPVIRAKVCEGKKDEPVYMDDKQKTEIIKARYFVKTTNPIKLKSHRDQSDKAHKQHYFVNNDSNYAIAYYGDLKNKNNKKHITSKAVINNLDAVIKAKKGEAHFPEIDKKGNPLRGQLMVGSKVILYQNNPQETLGLSKNELNKRIYVVIGFWASGTVKLRHQISTSMERGNSHYNYDTPNEQLLMSLNTVLLEEFDFDIDLLGHVTYKGEWCE